MPQPQLDLQERVTRRAATDPDFRRRLIDDPVTTLSGALGASVPAGIDIRVVEQKPDTVYLVLPPEETPVREISDAELDRVAGGWKYCWDTSPLCYDTKDCLVFTL